MGLLSQLFGPREAVITNGELVGAMQRAATNATPQSIRAVHEALLDSDLIIPTTQAVGDAGNLGWQRVEHEVAVPMITVRNDQGETAMLVFTDEESLKAWRAEGSAWVAMRGPDVFAMALETRVDHVVINPNGSTGGMIDRRQIASLAEGLAEEDLGDNCSVKTAMSDQTIAIRAPQQPVDPKLVERVRAALADRAEVAAAYVFEMAIGRGQPHLGVGVEFAGPMSPEAVHETMTAILSQTHGVAPEGDYFDFLPLLRDGLRELAREHGTRFYYAPLEACDWGRDHPHEC